MMLFDYLEKNPIIEIGKTSEALGLTFNTVSGAVKRLTDIGILKQTRSIRRNRTFAYEEYLAVLQRYLIESDRFRLLSQRLLRGSYHVCLKYTVPSG